MKNTYISIFGILLLAMVAACAATTPAGPATTLTVTPTEDLQGLPSDAAATLRSLEKVNDYPLYVMHYHGNYNYPKTAASDLPANGFACSLFAGLSQAGDRLFGRNFDWEFSPALLLFTDPPDGYASVSMVDLTFLGISPSDARSLTDLPLRGRKALLAAPSMPFDGMNEYGLAIAMAAVPDEPGRATSYDPSKPTYGSIGIMRMILDHARSVEEAVSTFNKVNISFAGGPPVHYLVADAGGQAALVEFSGGEMFVLPNEVPWHLATNHLRYHAVEDGGCPRYHILSDRLAASKGLLDPQGAMRLLAEVKQKNTQWSLVYNLTSGDISVVIGQAFDQPLIFHLDLIR